MARSKKNTKVIIVVVDQYAIINSDGQYLHSMDGMYGWDNKENIREGAFVKFNVEPSEDVQDKHRGMISYAKKLIGCTIPKKFAEDLDTSTYIKIGTQSYRQTVLADDPRYQI